MSDLIPWYAPWTHRGIIFLLALAGLYLAWRMGWRRRRLGYPACRRCLYDLRETPEGTPCPECGHVSKKRRTRQPLRRCAAASLPGLLLATALPVFIIARHTHRYGGEYWLVWGPGYWLFGIEQVGTHQHGPFVLKWYQDRRRYIGGSYGHLIIEPGGMRFEQSWYGWEVMNAGQDITGDGKPDLLLSEHTGGSSFAYVLVELHEGAVNESLRLSGQPSHCEDADGDGIWEYYTTTRSGSGLQPEDYKMQRLDKLIQDPKDLKPWRPGWLEDG